MVEPPPAPLPRHTTCSSYYVGSIKIICNEHQKIAFSMPLWNIVKQNDPTILGKLSKLKSGEIWEMVQSGDDQLAGCHNHFWNCRYCFGEKENIGNKIGNRRRYGQSLEICFKIWHLCFKSEKNYCRFSTLGSKYLPEWRNILWDLM